MKNIFLFGGSRCGLDNKKNLLFLAGCPYRSPRALLENYLIDEEANDYVCFSEKSSTLKLKFLEGLPVLKVVGKTVFAMNPNSGNIYHFLIEALFDFSNAILSGVHIDNIIVDDALPEKFLGLISDISPKINIIKLRKFELIEIENLIVFKDINYHYHWHRQLFSADGMQAEEINRSDKPHYMNSEWLKKFKKMLSNLYPDNEDPTYDDRSKLVLFIRNSLVRNTVNQHDLIDFFDGRGLVIDPAVTSFQELCYFLRDTKFICTQAGAAIVNALFCKNNPTFICWFYKGPETDIDLLIQFFDALEIKLVEVLAIPVGIKNSISTSGHIHKMQEADISQTDLICPTSELAKHLDL